MKQFMHVWMLLFLQFFYMLQLSVIKDSKYIFLLIVQFVLFSSTCCTPVVHNAYIYIYLMLTSTLYFWGLLHELFTMGDLSTKFNENWKLWMAADYIAETSKKY